jgi:hypothetical protein
VYTRADGLDDPIVARVAPQELPDPGEAIDLAFDLTQLHFFASDTGEALSTKAPAAPAA